MLCTWPESKKQSINQLSINQLSINQQVGLHQGLLLQQPLQLTAHAPHLARRKTQSINQTIFLKRGIFNFV
jgi:hypothetical protein